MKTKSAPPLRLTMIILGVLVAVIALLLLGCSPAKTTSDTVPATDFSDITVTVFQSPT